MVCIQWFFIKCWSIFPFLILIGSCFHFFPAHVIIEQAIAFFFQCAKERWKKKGGCFYSMTKLETSLFRNSGIKFDDFILPDIFLCFGLIIWLGKKKVVSFFIFSYFPTKIIIKKKAAMNITYHTNYFLILINYHLYRDSFINLARYAYKDTNYQLSHQLISNIHLSFNSSEWIWSIAQVGQFFLFFLWL